LPTPRKITLVAGSSEGDTALTAFDKALLAAGIGNLTLLKVSSILPPGAEYTDALDIPPGSLTPTAYGSVTSDVPGERIAAAIGVGIVSGSFGVIMECGGKCSREEAEDTFERMIREALAFRKTVPDKILIKGTEHVVQKIGCAFAGAALWY